MSIPTMDLEVPPDSIEDEFEHICLRGAAAEAGFMQAIERSKNAGVDYVFLSMMHLADDKQFIHRGDFILCKSSYSHKAHLYRVLWAEQHYDPWVWKLWLQEL